MNKIDGISERPDGYYGYVANLKTRYRINADALQRHLSHNGIRRAIYGVVRK